MSEHTPQAKVVKALGAAAKVQTTAPDPRLKIEAALWQMFFELPLSTLIEIRERATARQSVIEDAEEPLALAASAQPGAR